MTIKQQILEYHNKSKVNYYVAVNTKDRENCMIHSSATEARLRDIAKNEIVLEYDIDFKPQASYLYNRTKDQLKEDGYSFFVFDHQSRSPHIHVYDINGLEEMDNEMRHEYKKAFMRKYGDPELRFVDDSLAGEHLIALEYVPHFKHNTIKQLVTFSKPCLTNSLDIKLLEEARKIINLRNERKKDKIPHKPSNWFVEMVIKETFPTGKWANVIAKNLMIEIVNSKLDEDSVLGRLEQRDAIQVSSWRQWVEKEPREVLKVEIYKFLENYGYEYQEMKKKYSLIKF